MADGEEVVEAVNLENEPQDDETKNKESAGDEETPEEKTQEESAATEQQVITEVSSQHDGESGHVIAEENDSVFLEESDIQGIDEQSEAPVSFEKEDDIGGAGYSETSEFTSADEQETISSIREEQTDLSIQKVEDETYSMADITEDTYHLASDSFRSDEPPLPGYSYPYEIYEEKDYSFAQMERAASRDSDDKGRKLTPIFLDIMCRKNKDKTKYLILRGNLLINNLK